MLYNLNLIRTCQEWCSLSNFFCWSPYQSSSPSKSTPAAEIVAACEEFDEIVILKKVFTMLCNTSIDVFARVYGSKNPADVGKKLNSPLTEYIFLTLDTRILQVDL